MNPVNVFNYQLGLLSLVHLLISADGVIDQRERDALDSIIQEEDIQNDVLSEFQKRVETLKHQSLYNDGINLLCQCSEEERLCALVHLYRMAEADNFIHFKEIGLLLYAMKMTHINFEDVMLGANLARTYHKEFQFVE
jgi:uncharacterized tellurite resistance protein B-like protein